MAKAWCIAVLSAVMASGAEQIERLTALGPVRIRLVLTPTVYENAPSWKVVGEIKGADHPDEIVLIGGHLDSRDLGTGATERRCRHGHHFRRRPVDCGPAAAPQPDNSRRPLRRRGEWGFSGAALMPEPMKKKPTTS
jgi:hypothetical protein